MSYDPEKPGISGPCTSVDKCDIPSDDCHRVCANCETPVLVPASQEPASDADSAANWAEDAEDASASKVSPKQLLLPAAASSDVNGRNSFQPAPDVSSACAFIDRSFESFGDSSTESPGKGVSSEMIVGRSVKTRVLQKINGGSFGQIHLGVLVESGQEVAVKLERQKSLAPQLLNEGNVLRHLEGGPGIPKIHWFGMYEPEYNVMVMDLLGPSLQDLFSYCKHKFSLKTVLMLADQMINILAYVHKKQYVYRDVKPDNFVIGRGENSHKVYIIDFGLAKKISTHRFSVGHVSSSVTHPLVGTVRYASLHAHLGHEESPRDDLESLAYVLVYFLRGKLPWQGIPVQNKEEKFAKIKESKMNTPVSVLCEGLPPQFAEFVDMMRLMRREAPCNYCLIRELFKNLAREQSIAYDYQYDWVIRKQDTGREIEARGRTDHGHDSS